MRVATLISGKPVRVIEQGKAALNQQTSLDLQGAYALTTAKMVENLGWPECEEGIDAFIAKRRPKWE